MTPARKKEIELLILKSPFRENMAVVDELLTEVERLTPIAGDTRGSTPKDYCT